MNPLCFLFFPFCLQLYVCTIFYNDLTFAIISREPIATFTAVPIRIAEMYHARTLVLTRDGIAHVWTTKRRS